MFWIRFTNSRAIPSRFSSSVTVISIATVSFPSAATSQPGMSSDVMSKSAAVASIFTPSISAVHESVRSNCAMSACENPATSAEICFICFPYRGPNVLKFGLIRLVITSVVSSMNSSCLIFTSFRIKFLTASICSFSTGSSTGIRILLSGWRTLILTLRRSASTIDDTFWASAIFSSRSLFTSESFALGNVPTHRSGVR